jgi:dienelactone hydrolase
MIGMRGWRRVAAAALAAGALLGVAACGSSSGHAAGGTAHRKDYGCLGKGRLKGSITFKDASGHRIGGYVVGSPKATGVVLAHQAGGSLCQWAAKADELAHAGFQALAINSADRDVAEVTAGAALLRHRGAPRVELMGASKGGTAVLAAAARIRPRVAAVVSLSAPQAWGTVNAAATVPKLTMPLLYEADRGDVEFAGSTRALYDASRNAHDRALHVNGGHEHGVDMLGQDGVWPGIVGFLKRHG